MNILPIFCLSTHNGVDFKNIVDCVEKDSDLVPTLESARIIIIAIDGNLQHAAGLHLKLMPSNGRLSWVGQVECELRLLLG